MFPTLNTERLILRQLFESDVEEIFLLRSDKNINRYLNRKTCETREDALNFIRSIQNKQLLYWAITQAQNRKLIGTICLFDIAADLSKCEIGYELLTYYQGQGIMSETLKIILDFAFQTLGLKTIEAYTHCDNQSSTKLLQKYNFKKTENDDLTNPDIRLFSLQSQRTN